MPRVSVTVPSAQVEALWHALTASRRALTEEVEHAAEAVARGEPDSDRLRHARAELGEVVSLVAQLSTGGAQPLLTGEREPLRSAACDGLVVAIERLATAAARYWRMGTALSAVEWELLGVSEQLDMLRTLQRAPPVDG